jgi:hypothetical protein
MSAAFNTRRSIVARRFSGARLRWCRKTICCRKWAAGPESTPLTWQLPPRFGAAILQVLPRHVDATITTASGAANPNDGANPSDDANPSPNPNAGASPSLPNADASPNGDAIPSLGPTRRLDPPVQRRQRPLTSRLAC